MGQRLKLAVAHSPFCGDSGTLCPLSQSWGVRGLRAASEHCPG